ncbi:MAG: hypothetical protein PHE21_00625 [Candidatus Dojkabacteria bacterium]|nr:hypothetical protein [Candidatus Dojkabacteria bacterium]
MAKTYTELKKNTSTSELRKFISSIIDIATKPQIFSQWIKERKSWKHFWNTPEKIKIREEFEIKKIKK